MNIGKIDISTEMQYAWNDPTGTKLEEVFSYTDNDFIADITDLLYGRFDTGLNLNELTVLTTEAYLKMKPSRKLIMFDRYTASSFDSAFRNEIYSFIQEHDEKDEVYKLSNESSSLNYYLSKHSTENMMHRKVLEPLLNEVFKDIDFEVKNIDTEWKGFEISTASGGGFGERLEAKHLIYMRDEQGISIKEELFCAIAVYFMAITRYKQTLIFKEAIENQLTKDITEDTIDNIIADFVAGFKRF